MRKEQTVAAQEEAFSVMESYFSLQGEGMHTGRAAYFIRLGGCDVGCHWCDVKDSWDAQAHPKVRLGDLCKAVVKSGARRVVVTGGEPLSYDLTTLTHVLHSYELNVHLETSGVHALTGVWDWICLSPKKQQLPTPSVQKAASELKIIVYNRDDLRFAEEQAQAVPSNCHLFLQPEWSRREEVCPWLVDYLKQHNQWRLSLQTHKYIGLR